MIVGFDPSLSDFGVAYLIENKLHLLTFDLIGAIDWIRENYESFEEVVTECNLTGGTFVNKHPKESLKRYAARAEDIGKLKAAQQVTQDELKKLGVKFKRCQSKNRQRALDKYNKKKPINRLKLHQYLTKTSKEQFKELLALTDIELVQAKKGSVKLGSEHARDAATLIIYKRAK